MHTWIIFGRNFAFTKKMSWCILSYFKQQMIFQCTYISIFVLLDWRKIPLMKALKICFLKKQNNYICIQVHLYIRRYHASFHKFCFNRIKHFWIWVEISYSFACYASNAMYFDKIHQNEMMLLCNSKKVAQTNLRLLSQMAALH